MKKFLLVILCIVLMPVHVFACPAGDEFGRPYFEIFNREYTQKTMFYLGNSYYYRRELCLITDVHSIREAFSFPIVGRSVPELYGVWGEIFYPSRVDAGGTHFRINVGLQNTLEYWKEFVANSPNPIADMFYEILVERLHDDATDERFIRAKQRMAEHNITQALSHTLRVDHGVIFGDRVFNEIRDDLRIMFDPVMLDPVVVYMCDCFFHFTAEDIDTDSIVAINVDHFSGEIRQYPVIYENNLFRFTINEPGTFVLVSDTESFAAAENAPDNGIEENDNLPQETQGNGGNVLMIFAAFFAGGAVVIGALLLTQEKKPQGRKRGKK
ncbi:MAG: hypothetical protein FWB96_06075 [Defluviitaleaceae bacterium]|nr:hypothetical protein [Defluviitaleaceae bacterium]MCL2262430.1 hypothetical protein [Defluviitaleaceae bacterium]